MVQVLLIVAGVAIVSAVLYSLFGTATDYSQAAMNGSDARTRTITSTKEIAQAGALYAADYGVTAPLSIHPVIADGYLSTEGSYIPTTITLSGKEGPAAPTTTR